MYKENPNMKNSSLQHNIVRIFFLYFLLTNCTDKNQGENRVYFSIDPEDRKILIPVQINDSITANMVFDTGGSFFLDSTFVSQHPSLIPTGIPRKTREGSAWLYSKTTMYTYDTTFNITVGKHSLKYDQLKVGEWKKYLNCDAMDGVFNIPLNDTTHVWELNFENNYLAIHNREDFLLPEECFVLKTVDSPFRVQLPLETIYNDQDTLQLDHIYTIDTGIPSDIELLKPTQKEASSFKEKEDIIWTRDDHGYYLYYTVKANLLKEFQMDSVRLYTLDNPRDVRSSYLIGLNFLKRFNVFFDLKNKQVALQPINNFKRVVNPNKIRFYYSAKPNKEGRYVIDMIPDFKNNFFKEAGLQVGDEIIELLRSDSIMRMKLMREEKVMELIVPVDKNLMWGE